MSNLKARLAELQRQLALDEGAHMRGLDRAYTAAWQAGDGRRAEELGQLMDRLRDTIIAERVELRRLIAVTGGPFRLADAKKVNVSKGGNQAVVWLPGLDGAVVDRHVHLKDGKDIYGNNYRSFSAVGQRAA